jgi:regulator of sigma D
MNKLIEALTKIPKPPCENVFGSECKNYKKCEEWSLCCHAFVQYIHKGTFTAWTEIIKKRHKIKTKKLRYNLNPTAKLFDKFLKKTGD